MSFMVPVSLLLGLILTQAIVTEYLGWKLHFNPSLGKALFHVVYWPWMWVNWTWQFLQPAQRMMGKPFAVYPASVYDAFRFAPYVAAGGFLFSILGAALSTAPKGSNEDEDIYDPGSKWADDQTAKRDKLIDAKCGPIIGGFERGMGKVIPLRYPGQLGLSYVEPPGGGKSAFLTSNLLIPLVHEESIKWSEKERRVHPWGEEPNFIVSDPKFELFKQTSGYQKEVLGKDVFLLAPLGPSPDVRVDHDKLACYNPFWNIRLGSERGFQDSYFRTLGIVDPEGEGLKTHWDRTGLSWGAAVIEKLGYRSLNIGDYETFSLPGLLDFVSSFASMDSLLQYMLTEPDDPCGVFGWKDIRPDGTYGETTVKPSIQQAAREMLNKDPRERAGVYSTFIAFLAPYRSEILRRFVTKSTFDWSTTANNRKRASTIYIAMDPMDLPKLRPYLRQVFGAAIEELVAGGTLDVGGRSARGNFRPVVMPMDEIAAWKKLAEIEHGSGYFRGYGIMLWLIWQSVAQQKRYYGKDDVLNETMDVLLFGRPKMPAGAKEISELLGEKTLYVRKRSVAGGRFAIVAAQAQDSIDPIRVPVMSPKEIMQIDRERYLAFYNGHNYFLRKFEYFKNKTLSARAKIPYVRKSSVDATAEPLFVQSIKSMLGADEIDRWTEFIRKRRGVKPSAETSEDEKAPAVDRDPNQDVVRKASSVAGVAAATADVVPKEEERAVRSITVQAASPTQAYLKAAQKLREERARRQGAKELVNAR